MITNEYGVAGVQRELLVIIKEFHALCEREGVEYFLYAGTCIGAIRHKGFIPWDDDLDICMDRDNYEKLVSVFPKSESLILKRDGWLDRVQQRDMKFVDGRIPSLDVFVIDNVPDSVVASRVKILLLSAIQGMMKQDVDYSKYSPKYRPLLRVTHSFGRIVPRRVQRAWYEKVSMIGDSKDTKQVHVSNDSYVGIRNFHPSEVFEARLLVGFEDTMLYVPEGYDAYLRKVYGDYMTPPNMEERGKISHRSVPEGSDGHG